MEDEPTHRSLDLRYFKFDGMVIVFREEAEEESSQITLHARILLSGANGATRATHLMFCSEEASSRFSLRPLARPTGCGT